MLVPLGEYRPDISDYNAQHSGMISNVVPQLDGYGPFYNINPFTTAITAACRGMFRALASDGTIRIFAGTATKLYLMDNADGTWDNVSSSSGATNYALPSTDQWQFRQFGDFVVAVQVGDAPQVYEIGTSTYFAALSGSPPNAKYVTVIGQFLVLSGLSSEPFRIQWSAIGDITGWTPGTASSDFQDFPDGGIVRGVAGGEYGVVFQDNSIRRMIFSPGSSEIFRFERIVEDNGLYCPLSIVASSEMVFFLGPDGFHQMQPTGYPVPIGKEKVDRTFFRDWDESAPQLMIGANDPRSHRVMWAYKSTSGQTGLFDRILIYDYILQKWSRIEGLTGEYMAPMAVPGVTLENLDSINASIDAMTVSLDDYSLGTNLVLAAADSAHKIGLFSGDSLEATIETAEIGNDARRTFVRGFRPVTDAATVYGRVSARQNLQDTATLTDETLVNSIGVCHQRKSTRLYRPRMRIPEATTWTYVTGIEPDIVMEGRR